MTQQLIYFNSRDKLIRLDVQKIVYFEGDGNYTYIVTANKQKVCVTMNLAHTEEALDECRSGVELEDFDPDELDKYILPSLASLVART